MRVLYPFLIFLGLVFLILPVSIPVIKTSADFSMFNTDWNGCSEFARFLHEKGELVPLIYPYNSVGVGDLNGALIIVGPDTVFSKLEAEEVRTFLENGGTVLIADDFGTANTLLMYLGVNARFSSNPLEDIFYSKRKEFPIIVKIEGIPVTSKSDGITLNVPSALVGTDGNIFSSKVSVLGESMRSYPIMAEIRYGNGKIILLSDPSILINEMFDENRQFIESLITYIGVKKFYFDEAHHSDFNPYLAGTVIVHRELDKEKAFVIFLAVAALAAVVEGGFIRKIFEIIYSMRSKREEDLLEDLPDWVDPDLLKKIIHEIKTGSKIGGNYGRKSIYSKSGE